MFNPHFIPGVSKSNIQLNRHEVITLIRNVHDSDVQF